MLVARGFSKVRVNKNHSREAEGRGHRGDRERIGGPCDKA